MTNNAKVYPHYFKKLPEGISHVDVYAVLRLFQVTDPEIAHAIKKLLCAGSRGAKDKSKDLQEAVASVQRCLELTDQFCTDLRVEVEKQSSKYAIYCASRLDGFVHRAASLPGVYNTFFDARKALDDAESVLDVGQFNYFVQEVDR